MIPYKSRESLCEFSYLIEKFLRRFRGGDETASPPPSRSYWLHHYKEDLGLRKLNLEVEKNVGSIRKNGGK